MAKKAEQLDIVNRNARTSTSYNEEDETLAMDNCANGHLEVVVVNKTFPWKNIAYS